MDPKLTLYGYFRSSAAYRVRIALNLKAVPYESVPVHLVKDGGRHRQPWYAEINPQQRVPSLLVEHDGGRLVLTQSMAILEWIEETWPQPALLPSDPIARARVRAAADLVACDIHPLNNLATLAYLKGPLGHSQAEADAWYRHWIVEGFRALEQMIEPGPFCFGAAPGLADICLVPQLFNARRFAVPLDAFPRLVAAEAAASALEPFAAAHPSAQPDAE